MKRSRVIIEVAVDLDPVPGHFNDPEDFVQDIYRLLPTWYYPSVLVKEVVDVDRKPVAPEYMVKP